MSDATPPADLIDPAEAWAIVQGIEAGAVPVTLDKDPCDHFYQDVTATTADGWAFVITCRGYGYGYLSGVTAPDGKRATFDDIWGRGDVDPWRHLKDYGVIGGWGIGEEYADTPRPVSPEDVASLPAQMMIATAEGIAAAVVGDHVKSALHLTAAANLAKAIGAVPETMRPDMFEPFA